MTIEPTAVLSSLSGVVTATFKIAEKVYEIRAVGEQSTSLVETINQVNQQLDTARSLRRQKSHLFSTSEKDGFEQTFSSTERALGHVGKLVENARVDQQVYGPGSIRFQNKVLFVLRDSPHIMVSLQQLVIANQHLSTAVLRLDHRQAPRIVIAQAEHDVRRPTMSAQRPPPSYEDSQMIAAVREKSLRRRASALSAIASSADVVDGGSSHSCQASGMVVSPSRLVADGEVFGDSTELIASPDVKGMIITSLEIDETSHRFSAEKQRSPVPPTLGRARSRRWLEAHCK